ncbi:MAG: hypothetical protein ACLFQV_13870, partial [Vulcanimicrobiota bacterium]
IRTDKDYDIQSKVIQKKGVEKVTYSRLQFLEPGEEIIADRIVAYPSIAYLIKDAVDALIRYPYGCSEQISARMYGLVKVHNLIMAGSIKGNLDRIDQFLHLGARQLNDFLQNNLFSLWENSPPNMDVTMRVLKNLAPLKKLNILNLGNTLNKIIDTLLNKEIKNNLLIPYDIRFADDIKSVRDAALLYKFGIAPIKARQYIEQMARVTDAQAYWEDPGCWAGRTEATSYALQVMAKENKDIFSKGFNYLSQHLQKGQLYSTSDTCAFIELLEELNELSPARVIVDEEEFELKNPLICRALKAQTRTLTRIDEDKIVNLLDKKSNFGSEIKIDRTSVSPGEKIKLSIIPEEKTIAPVAKIFLPGNLAAPFAGVNKQVINMPVKYDEVSLDLYAIRKGTGTLAVVLTDMYDSEKTGVLTGIKINVS